MWSKLKALLTNTWMNNVDYLAAMAHVGWACLIILGTALIASLNVHWMVGMSIGMVLFAGLKEYVYDANFELPKQTFADNTEDFVAYVVGVGLAWAIIGVTLARHMLLPA